MVERKKELEPRPIGLGSVEVITGPKFSGKTDEMIRRLRKAEIARHEIQVFKSIIDNKYSKNKIVSRSGHEFEAVSVDGTQQMKELLKKETSIVAIDGAQFFDDEIASFVQRLADEGIHVIVAGLDTNYRGEPFGPMPVLMAQAETLDKFHAVCMVCGGKASFTQRLINGEPASFDDPTVVVGASELYEARCRIHHEVSGKP